MPKRKLNPATQPSKPLNAALQFTVPDNDDWYSFCASLLPGTIAQLISYYLPAVLSLYRKILVEVLFLSACKSDLQQGRLFFVTSKCVSLGGGEGPCKCLSIINTFVPSIGVAQAMRLPQTDEQEGTHMAWLSVFSPALIPFGFMVLILVIEWRTLHRRRPFLKEKGSVFPLLDTPPVKVALPTSPGQR